MKPIFQISLFFALVSLFSSCSQEQDEPIVDIYINAKLCSSYDQVNFDVRKFYMTSVNQDSTYLSVVSFGDGLGAFSDIDVNCKLDLKNPERIFISGGIVLNSSLYSGLRIDAQLFDFSEPGNEGSYVYINQENPSSQICCNYFELEQGKRYEMELIYDFDTLINSADTFGQWEESRVELIVTEI